jgi:hypothetical protein
MRLSTPVFRRGAMISACGVPGFRPPECRLRPLAAMLASFGGRRRRAMWFATKFARPRRRSEDSWRDVRRAVHHSGMVEPVGIYAPHHFAIDAALIGERLS